MNPQTQTATEVVTNNVVENAVKKERPQNKHLRPKPFTSEYQPEKNGRPLGSLNRSTVFKRFLGMQIDIEHPEKTAETLKISMYEAAALGQLKAAIAGNTQAWVEIQNTLHGKQSEKLEIEQTTRIVQLESTIKSLVADSIIKEILSRIDTLPEEYRARFNDVTDVDSLTQSFISQVLSMDAATVKEQLGFSDEEIKLLREHT